MHFDDLGGALAYNDVVLSVEAFLFIMLNAGCEL